MADQLHLVLDLDGVLVCCESAARRPHLDTFLDHVFATFASVSLWSAASQWHVDACVGQYMHDRPFQCVWTSAQTTRRVLAYAQPTSRDCNAGGNQIRVKKLRRLWRRYGPAMHKHNTLVVDDTHTTYVDNYGNAVAVDTFYSGDDTDRGLLELMERLDAIRRGYARDGSVRHIEKRVLK